MKAHLLHPGADFDFGAPLPPGHEDVVKDLELSAVLDAMAAGDGYLREVSAKVLLGGITDPAQIRYRQAVLADCLAQPDVIRQMYAIAVGAIEDKRRTWGFALRTPSAVLSAGIRQLEVLLVRLRQLRQLADAHAHAFASDGLRTLLESLQTDLDDEYLASIEGHLRQLRFKNGELLSAQLGADNSGINYVLRSPGARRGLLGRVGVGPRYSYSFVLSPRDDAGAQALGEIVARGVNQVANAAARSADHVTSYFTMLKAELGFYVSCLNLARELAARGVPVTMPDPSPCPDAAAGVRWELSCTDLRDVSLALRADVVVGNDVDADGADLLIVTGANSGGKSTFLRSAGQAQLMLQCGMFVTAAAFRASVCTGTFTHFIREEDADLVSGRLDEELARMSRIADHLRPGCLVLFNESFAATNEREGSEIGRQVVGALLDAGMRVYFVTHQFTLASGFARDRPSSTVFLRAERERDGRRTFRLVPGEPLPTSFGIDIYERIGGFS